MSSTSAHPFAGFGANEWLVDEMYQQYLKDPSSVDKAWWDFFSDYSQSGGAPAQGAPTDGADGATAGPTAPSGPSGPSAAGVDRGAEKAIRPASPAAPRRAVAAHATEAPAQPSEPAQPARPLPRNRPPPRRLSTLWRATRS